MLEQQQTAGQLLGLDENVRACVLVHLSPSDLSNVSLACKALARDAQGDMVWATLYLRRFGSDFWGEHIADPHPYHEVPPCPSNRWLCLPLVSVFEAFLHEESEDNPQESAARCGLLTFVQKHETCDSSLTGWKAAYQRMHKMVSAWQAEAEEAYLIAGQTSFGRLSVVLDAIKREIKEVYTEMPFNCVDLTSPGGSCRVLRVDMSPENEIRPCMANFCLIAKPRNWFDAEGKQLFRGLQLRKRSWKKKSLHVIYVLDCERMHEEDHQEMAFRELHGLIGEGKGHFKRGLFLNLFLVNLKNESDVDSLLTRLKLPHFVEPLHWCPYYAGPVIFLITTLSMKMASDDPAEETEEDRETRETRIIEAFHWLSSQPTERLHWSVPDDPHWHVCALTDERSEKERLGDFGDTY